MSVKPRPSRPRHKPRPRSRPRLFTPAPLPVPQSSMRAQWTSQHVTLEELLLDHSLPQLVQVKTPGLWGHDGRPLAIPLDKPIMLAEQRTARHLLARIVQYDEKTKSYNESLDSVVIPEDYEGHFLKLHSRTTKDKTHVKTLDAIAHDDTPAFLNLSDITSFPARPRDSRDKSRFVYTVGNVFLVDEPLPSDSKQTQELEEDGKHSAKIDGPERKVAVSSRSRGGNGLMKCLDERGMSVMVPTNQMGEMVTVQANGNSGPKLSVKSSDMIANEQFPLLTRYAYSKKHPRLTAFSKLLTLLDSFEETSIIACIVDSSSLMLIEIPVSSSLHFQRAVNLDELLHIPRLYNALKACRTQGRGLARDIKFKYKFSHRVQETSRRMMKLKEDDMPSATVRTRLIVTESFVYI